jgi:D-glycero-alpha-D-manno-heptose-7-phosphate kinase
VIVSRCPVRISLAGGSTDLDSFLDYHGQGSVISFSANIYNYITLRSDRLGINGLDKKFVIDYMRREVVDEIHEIKNDVAREVLLHFGHKPTTVWFTSDIYSSGSGLASSTSYLIALICAVCSSLGKNLDKRKICELALELERNFNPLTGKQDPYGCGMGGFNRFKFYKNGTTIVESLPLDFLEEYDMHLVPTGVSRSSTEVLKTVDPEKCVSIFQVAQEMHSLIMSNDSEGILKLISEGWKLKKSSSRIMMENEKISSLDQAILDCKSVLAHRLLGAGNGGYFLCFTNKDFDTNKLSSQIKDNIVKIEVCNDGPKSMRIK